MVSEALTNASPCRPIADVQSTDARTATWTPFIFQPAITLPNAFGAPGMPLPPGQVVQALVLELIESDVFRLQLPQAVVDVRSSVPLTPGSTITLAVKSGGANAKLVIYSDAPAGYAVCSGSFGDRSATSAPSLAGREPIGEAVVIARAPAGPVTAPAGQNAAPTRNPLEPAVLRDAPSIAPALTAPAARPPETPARILTPEQAVGEAIRAAAPAARAASRRCSRMSSRRPKSWRAKLERAPGARARRRGRGSVVARSTRRAAHRVGCEAGFRALGRAVRAAPRGGRAELPPRLASRSTRRAGS